MQLIKTNLELRVIKGEKYWLSDIEIIFFKFKSRPAESKTEFWLSKKFAFDLKHFWKIISKKFVEKI